MAKVAGGLGKVAGGAARVAGGMTHALAGAGRVTGTVLAHAAPVVARASATVARAALPIAENVVEAALIQRSSDPDPDPTESEEHASVDGPLIDNHDPCNACPEDLSCDQCLGNAGAACRYTPPGAFTRCESSR